MCFSCPPRPFRVGLRRRPSGSHLSRGLPSQMLAQILVHVGVIPPLHGQFNQQIDPVIVRVRPRFPLGRLSAVFPCPSRNLPHKPQMRLSRPIGRGVNTRHEPSQLRYELGDAGSCGGFGERRQLLNLCSDIQVRFVDLIQLLKLFQEVGAVGALPDSGLNLPLKEFLFTQRFDERAFGPNISMLLTREEPKLEKILVPPGQVFRDRTPGVRSEGSP